MIIFGNLLTSLSGFIQVFIYPSMEAYFLESYMIIKILNISSQVFYVQYFQNISE